MRIGIDCRMYSSRFTGIGRYVYELTENLFKIDQENEYVLFFNNPEYSEFNPPNARISKVLVNSPHYSSQEQTIFLKHLRKSKLDLMHFTHFNAPIFYFGRSVVTIHDLTLSFFPGRKMTSFIHRLGYQITIKSSVTKAKKIISVSHNTKKDLQNVLHVSPKKIEVIYLGVNGLFYHEENQQKIHSVQEKYAISKPFLLYSGVWRTHKNLLNLIRAFSILKEKHGWDGCLVITGRKDPHYAPEIENLVNSLNLQKSIIFVGHVDEGDLVILYNAAKVYVFPSLYEGFGLPPLEAMQCKTPVAASNVSAIPEVCGQGNALFFDPKNPQDMAEKIHILLTNPAQRQKIIENGFKHVKQFSWEKMAKETLKVYNEALK